MQQPAGFIVCLSFINNLCIMKTSHALFLAIFICNLFFITSIVKGQLSATYPVGGTVGTPITFTREWSCTNSDPGYTEYWDFGPTATPATAVAHEIIQGLSVFITQDVMYSTAGDKTIKSTLVQSGGSSSTGTGILHIFDCSKPSIP